MTEDTSQSSCPVAGLGVDIVEVERMERVLERTPSFAERVYSQDERAYCEAHAKPAAHYATHFAAKEAVLKALGTGFSSGVSVRDIEVSHDEKGRPFVVLHGRAANIAAEKGVLEMPVSLSRTCGTAVANAIAVTEELKPHFEEKTSSQERLVSAFKKARGMLDELAVRVEAVEKKESSGKA